MVFPFTFNFSVPGLFNPFRTAPSSSNQPPPKISDHTEVFKNQFRTHQTPTSEHCHRRSQESGYRDIPAPAYPSSSSSNPIPIPIGTTGRRISRSQLPKIPRRHSPSPSPSSLSTLPLSRKRGWEPAFGVDSIQSLTSNGKSSSTTSLTFVSSSGYLDTPAKYREMAEDITMSDSNYREIDTQYDEDAPPAKKRRGLAGSIVSTAVSAALIGTAVGLTVYRLWRDRGKEAQITHDAHSESPQDPDHDKQIPPPPYDAGHWRAIEEPVVPASAPTSASIPQPQTRSVPATPRSMGRRVGGAKKTVVAVRQQHSTRRARGNNSRTHNNGNTKHGFGSPRSRHEFDFGHGQDGEREEWGQGCEGNTEVEDKMDWLGDKMALLIEQGRRALQSEVVVMSEAKEDEVDDGRGGWEEEEDGWRAESDLDNDVTRSPYNRSRAGSVRSLTTHRNGQRKSRPRDIAIAGPSSVRDSSPASQAKVGLGLYGVNTTSSSFSSYPSGSLSSSPRRSGFVGLSSSYATPSYAAPSTSYTHTHASAGFVPSSVPSSFTNINAHSSSTPSRGYGHVRGMSYESGLPLPSSAFSTPSAGAGVGAAWSVSEETAGWESPEIREGMERARARLLARRNGATGV